MTEEYQLKLAELSDLQSWMELVELVRHNFPGLESDEELEKYQQIVIKNIGRKTALCVQYRGIVVGVLLFSYNRSCISFMAVHPDHRRHGIASAMIKKMLTQLPEDKDITVVTFREEDEKGAAPRALYQSFGFEPDELLTELGYPNQKLILHRKR